MQWESPSLVEGSLYLFTYLVILCTPVEYKVLPYFKHVHVLCCFKLEAVIDQFSLSMMNLELKMGKSLWGKGE